MKKFAPGSHASQPTPTLVSFPAGVTRWNFVAGGEMPTLLIGDNGQLYSAGCDFLAAESPCHLLPRLVPLPTGQTGWTRAATSRSLLIWLALTESGQLYGWWGSSFSSLRKYPAAPGGRRWAAFAIGEGEVLTLTDNGRLFAASVRNGSGLGYLQEVPPPTGTTQWLRAASGNFHSHALADDGNIYSWGANYWGQIGNGTILYDAITLPQQVTKPAGVSRWLSVSAGYGHCLALSDDGRVFSWGRNHKGQLGLGITNEVVATPMAVPGLSNVTAISAGNEHSLAIDNCRVVAWGDNSLGQLGIGVMGGISTQPTNAAITENLCSTNVSLLPTVSIVAVDNAASELTYRTQPALGIYRTNTAEVRFSSSVVVTQSLSVTLSVRGTASNGVDYVSLPTTVTIPAGTNFASVVVRPIADGPSEPAETIEITLESGAYELGSPTNVTIVLDDYEFRPQPPMPFTLQLATKEPGKVLTIEASTNLVDWVAIATVTNATGKISFTEGNAGTYKARFFRIVEAP